MKKMKFLDLISFVTEEKENLQHDYQVIKEGVAPVKEQLDTVKKELEKTKHEHVAAKKELEETLHEHLAAKKELEEAKHEHVAAKKELEETKYEHVAAKKELEEAKHEDVAAKKELEEAKQQLAQRNEELEVLRKKLQESEAMHTQLHQQKESAPGSEPIHSRRATRSTHKREMSLQGLLSNDVDGHRPKKHRSNQHASREDDLEVIRQKLIKYLGIKEMGKLDEKLFRDACSMKLPPRKSGAKAFEVYTLWQELLNNPNWKPFKIVKVEEVVVDVDDVKLQGLKRAWGEGPFNPVISALVERKEYNIGGRGRTVDFWNYEEGRKATPKECVEHILDALRNSNSSV